MLAQRHNQGVTRPTQRRKRILFFLASPRSGGLDTDGEGNFHANWRTRDLTPGFILFFLKPLFAFLFPVLAAERIGRKGEGGGGSKISRVAQLSFPQTIKREGNFHFWEKNEEEGGKRGVGGDKKEGHLRVYLRKESIRARISSS